MLQLENFLNAFLPWLPFAGTLIVSTCILLLLDKILFGKNSRKFASNKMVRQISMLGLTAIGVIVVVLALPFEGETKNEILKLFGLLLTAVIAFSSTTFAANATSGFMLKALKNFRPGDFLSVESHFGRVSDIGLLRTEIQSDDRSLITLPNHYLVTHPVKVLRYSGTFISAEISLGYDVDRATVEDLLKSAITKAGLEDPFVHIVALGDYSITYKAAGFLKEVKLILSKRSWLMATIVDSLHAAGIEIASPTLMSQRVYPQNHEFLSTPTKKSRFRNDYEDEPESIIFDKADEAESTEQLKIRLEKVTQAHAQLTTEVTECDNAEDIKDKKERMKRLEAVRDRIIERLNNENS